MPHQHVHPADDLEGRAVGNASEKQAVEKGASKDSALTLECCLNPLFRLQHVIFRVGF